MVLDCRASLAMTCGVAIQAFRTDVELDFCVASLFAMAGAGGRSLYVA